MQSRRQIPLAIALVLMSGFARAQNDSGRFFNRALDLLEDGNARQAVAVLADAARRYLQNRKIGGLLYSLLRDKRWPMPAILPVKLPKTIMALDFSDDSKLVIADAEDGTVRILDAETGKLLDGTVKRFFDIATKRQFGEGTDRTLSPRTFSTIESNVIERVNERSLEALYELFEADTGNPLILAAMSLFVSIQRQGEFLAQSALDRADMSPLARAYVGSTYAKYGRMDDAQRVLKNALVAEPHEPRILRRAAKLDARQGNKAATIEKLDRAVAVDPDDVVTYRDYGWQMYDLDEAAKAMVLFKKADEFYGGRDTDVNAGIALAAAAMGDDTTPITRYKRMIKIDAEWKEPEYIKSLVDWTDRELDGLERIRKMATPQP